MTEKHFGEHVILERLRARTAYRIGRTVSVRGVDRVLRAIYSPEAREGSYTTAVTKLRDGTLFHVDTRSFLEWRLYIYGEYEPYVQQLFPLLLRPGDAAIDVGANIGLHTVALARAAGPSGTIMAVEPYAPVLQRLERNLALNGVDSWVRIVPKAAADEPGTIRLRVPRPHNPNQGQASILALSHLGENGDTVECVRLDDMIEEQQIGRIGILKIHVQGGERSVFAGARRLLDDHRPAIVLRWNLGFLTLTGEELLWPLPLPPDYSVTALRRGLHEPLGSEPPLYECVVVATPDERGVDQEALTRRLDSTAGSLTR